MPFGSAPFYRDDEGAVLPDEEGRAVLPDFELVEEAGEFLNGDVGGDDPAD